MPPAPSFRILATAAVLATILAAATDARLAAQTTPAAAETRATRFFFVADAHSRHRLVQRFIDDVLRERPGLVIDGGDLVHDGTESEFRRALDDRARLDTPWRAVRGNHDALLRGPAFEPPSLPDLDSFDHDGVRFVLLDNHDGALDDALFTRLEEELRAGRGRRTIVVMHVPPVISREPVLARLRHLAPFPLSEPAMSDASQVERFMALMETHDVIAVLAGHTHAPGEVERNGVRYITAGAVGGLTPGFGIANEYLDLRLDGRVLHVQRVPVGRAAGNPVTLLARAFRFYAELNGFNHAAQGWNYVPSASVQLRTALTRIESAGDEVLVVTGAASFERVLGSRGRQAFLADVGIGAGRRELLPQVSAAYRIRPIGTYNRNVSLSGGLSANGGLLRGRGTAGIGARAAVGMEWRGITFEVVGDRATNLRALSITAGRRY